ncbi:helix-turn-helix transcriptional regulator [Methanolobus chelungpuianus]|uniref:Transcriptional regulator n=1 Tax=Methanolobus chelungpuianus TaxID=502115 RepID=A0AAE3HCN8_9EURY|nr:winged helix-turn-helix domain-containing protein [Methanolobus chelungpuianus]MCQ6963543.1 transcriptional regulator [Methanolobus chelungpuianus]
MKKPLLDVLFASEKRKQVILLLRDGAKEMQDLLSILNTTRNALLSQIRMLEEHYLVSHSQDTYELTTLGKMVADQIAPLVGTVETFGSDVEYWGTHKIDFLSPDLSGSITAMKDCDIVSPSVTEMYEIHKSFQRNSKLPTFIYVVTPFLYPNYQESFSEMLGNGVNLYFIIPREVLDKIKTSHRADFEEFMKSKHLHLFMYNRKMDFLFLVVDDFHLLMGLFKKNGDYDNRYLLCSGINAVNWGKAFFEYCLEDSTPIAEI